MPHVAPKCLATYSRWVVEDMADGDEIHLAAEILVGRVDADGAAIARGAGMDIVAVDGDELRIVLQFGNRHKNLAGAVINEDVLVALKRIGVEEEPLAAGQDVRVEIGATHFRQLISPT